MARKIWYFAVLVLLIVSHSNQALGSIALQPRQNVDIAGPISNIMQNLIVHITHVTDDVITQLSTKIERTTRTIVGDIEVILAQAMDRLTQPILEAQAGIASGQCQELLSMDEVRNHIDAQLSLCTKDLNDILVTFQGDTQESSTILQTNVAEISQLPNNCQEGVGFGSTITCFIDRISEINRDIASALNRASLAVLQTLQAAKHGANAAQVCADNAVADTVAYLDGLLANCQINGV